MQAVDVLNYALRLRSQWGEVPLMTMHVDGELVLDGNLNAFTNPAIEAGLIHCRALLEFLGLCERKGQLSNRSSGSRKPDDVGIEDFRNADGPLKIVAPEIALSRYPGPREEAEKALLTVFRVANKGLAHVTQSLADDPESGQLIEIASRGVPALIVSFLYRPLGLPAPDYKIKSRPRDV